MKRYIAVLASVLAVTIVMPSFGQERVDSKIRFNDLYGEVSIRPNAEEDDAYEYAELDTVIFEDDRIRTKEDSGAILGLEDMSTFVIKPDSTLIISSEDDYSTKVEMIAGRIIANVKKMSEGKTMGFEMSQCVAGIKGTMVDLQQDKSGRKNRISVIRGRATVKFGDKYYEVPAGSSLEIDDNKVATDTIDPGDNLNAYEEVMNSWTERLSDEELLKKLGSQSYMINETLKEYFNDLNNADSSSKMNEAILNYERYSGEMFEFNVFLQSALKRNLANIEEIKEKAKEFNKKFQSSINEALDKAKKNFRNDPELSQKAMELIQNLSMFDEVLNKASKESQGAGNTSLNSDSETLINGFDSFIAVALKNVDSVVKDLSNESSYDDFKSAAVNCRNYNTDITEAYNDFVSKANESKCSGIIPTLSKKHQSALEYIAKKIGELESVPEISSDLIKNMNDIEHDLPNYAKRVREYLKEYNAIEKSSVDAQKRYVEAVSKLIVNYDRTKRRYVKANRMHDRVIKDFKKSSYKTAEYNQVIESWDRVESAMSDLDRESSELSSCVEALKSQLESFMGK